MSRNTESALYSTPASRASLLRGAEAKELEGYRQANELAKSDEAQRINLDAFRAGQEQGAGSVIAEFDNLLANNYPLAEGSPEALEMDANIARGLNYQEPGLLEQVESADNGAAGLAERAAIVEAGGTVPSINDPEFGTEDKQELRNFFGNY